MATPIQQLRGTASELDAYTGANGVLTWDETNKLFRGHDGVTPGGFSSGLFKAAGTGAVSRSVQSKLRERVSARDYGFDEGNTSAGNKAALQTAVDAISIGGIVSLPAGNFNVETTGSTCIINNPGVVIEGEEYATNLIAASDTGAVFDVNSWLAHLTGFRITTAVSRTADAYVNVRDMAQDFRLSHFNMNAGFVGIDIPQSLSSWRVEHGKIEAIKAVTGSGMRVGVTGSGTGSYDGTVLDVLFSGGAGALAPAYGIDVRTAGDMRVNDSQFVLCGVDLNLAPGNGQTIASFWSQSTFYDTAQRGLLANVGDGGNIVRSIFDECWFSSHTADGALLVTTGTGVIDGVDFNGCHFFGNGASGLNLAGAGTKNVAMNGGAACGNVDGGFLVGDGVNEWRVTGGARLGAGYGFPGNARGLSLAGSSDNYVLVGNDLRGNSGGPTFGLPAASSTKQIGFNLGL